MLLAAAIIAAFLVGVVFATAQARERWILLERIIVGESATVAQQRERIRQLEHTLDEARTQSLNLTPPVLRDAALRDGPTAHVGYDEELLRELNAIESDEHRVEYVETIAQMRREQPGITDKHIRLTLFP